MNRDMLNQFIEHLLAEFPGPGVPIDRGEEHLRRSRAGLGGLYRPFEGLDLFRQARLLLLIPLGTSG